VRAIVPCAEWCRAQSGVVRRVVPCAECDKVVRVALIVIKVVRGAPSVIVSCAVINVYYIVIMKTRLLQIPPWKKCHAP
jgi:hypothetical protein